MRSGSPPGRRVPSPARAAPIRPPRRAKCVRFRGLAMIRLEEKPPPGSRRPPISAIVSPASAQNLPNGALPSASGRSAPDGGCPRHPRSDLRHLHQTVPLPRPVHLQVPSRCGHRLSSFNGAPAVADSREGEAQGRSGSGRGDGQPDAFSSAGRDRTFMPAAASGDYEPILIIAMQ